MLDKLALHQAGYLAQKRLARGLRNGWTEAWARRSEEIAAYPLQGWFAAQLRSAVIWNELLSPPVALRVEREARRR